MSLDLFRRTDSVSGSRMMVEALNENMLETAVVSHDIEVLWRDATSTISPAFSVIFCSTPHIDSDTRQMSPKESPVNKIEARVAELEKALESAREIVDACAGDNRPATEWASEVREKIDAALSAARRAPEAQQKPDQLRDAAPDLLAALKLLDVWFNPAGSSITARWERIPPVDRLAIVNATRAAIARAEGR